MKRIAAYGVSRTRDAKGNVVKREFKPFVMCLHSSCGGGRENMMVLIAEEYEEYSDDDSLSTRMEYGGGRREGVCTGNHDSKLGE